jgi:voltage-gated sodium channel
MGLEATPPAATRYGSVLEWVFLVSQVIFVVEIAARWAVAPAGTFFRESWNRFDFAVVALSLVPAVGGFALVARIFRIFRVLRLVSVGEVLWGSVLRKDGGARAIVLAIALVLLSGYVFALIGFHLFGDTLTEWSSLSRSVSSMAQSLTPGGFIGVLNSPGPLLVFHCAFYVTLLSTAINLAASFYRTRRERSR